MIFFSNKLGTEHIKPLSWYLFTELDHQFEETLWQKSFWTKKSHQITIGIAWCDYSYILHTPTYMTSADFITYNVDIPWCESTHQSITNVKADLCGWSKDFLGGIDYVDFFRCKNLFRLTKLTITSRFLNAFWVLFIKSNLWNQFVVDLDFCFTYRIRLEDIVSIFCWYLRHTKYKIINVGETYWMIANIFDYFENLPVVRSNTLLCWILFLFSIKFFVINKVIIN